MAMTTSLLVFPLAIGAGALEKVWIKIAATMVYSIGKRMVN